MAHSFRVLQLGGFPQWRDLPGAAAPGRTFIERPLDLDFFGVTVNLTHPGEGSTGWHSHRVLEELYLFLAGQGEMALDGEVVPVQAGTAVRVAQGVMRAWRCRPDSPEPLAWICVRAGGARLADIGADHTLDRETLRPWSA